MTLEQSQKMQVRLTSLQNAITGNNETPPTEKIIHDAQSIYEYLTKDDIQLPLVKPFVN